MSHDEMENEPAGNLPAEVAKEFGALPFHEQRLRGGRSFEVKQVREMFPPRDPRTLVNPPKCSVSEAAMVQHVIDYCFQPHARRK